MSVEELSRLVPSLVQLRGYLYIFRPIMWSTLREILAVSLAEGIVDSALAMVGSSIHDGDRVVGIKQL